MTQYRSSSLEASAVFTRLPNSKTNTCDVYELNLFSSHRDFNGEGVKSSSCLKLRLIHSVSLTRTSSPSSPAAATANRSSRIIVPGARKTLSMSGT